ncbi:hypothetical protein I6E23_05680 [Prevotella brevis]|nr:hypothetical protein [Xylanibacter brevis]
MKKFIKSIEISTDNILEVLDCPIVECIRKETDRLCVEGRGELYIMRSALVVDVARFGLPFAIDRGCVLAIDICDTWYAFTREEWDKHKNDEIMSMGSYGGVVYDE